jgi:hypothetical protein
MAKLKVPAKKSSSSKGKAKEPIELVATLEETLDPTDTFKVDEKVIENPPNVIWSSEKKEDGSLKHGDPPPFLKFGMLHIDLPSAEAQLQGFYSQHARILVREKNGFKFFRPKG